MGNFSKTLGRIARASYKFSRSSLGMIDKTERRRLNRRTNTRDSENNLRVMDRRLWADAGSDRRTTSRFLGSFPLLLSFETDLSKEYREVGIEVGSHGFRIRTTKEYPIRADSNVCIYPPELFLPIQIVAQIKWRKFDPKTKTYLYGFNFKNITPEAMATLITFIDSNLKDQSKLRSRITSYWKVVFYQNLLKPLLIRSNIGRQGILNGKADSGLTFDHIYSRKAGGSGFLGRFVDWVLLNLPAAKASRYRKDLIAEAVKYQIDKGIQDGRLTRILDLGSGMARYLIESIGQKEIPHVQALCLDQDAEVVQNGQKISGGRQIRFMKFDIFQMTRLKTLSEKSGWRPNMVIMSGLIYYFSDDRIRHLLNQIHEWLEPGGILIVTNMIKNPNKKLIGHLFIMQGGNQWIPLGRPPDVVRTWLIESGFSVTKIAEDPWGMYNVFSAQKTAESTRISPFELLRDGHLIRGKLIFPNSNRPIKGFVLFVHGLGYSFSSYRIDSPLFCGLDLALCLYNMRGHSTSDGEWSLENSIADVKKIIDTICSRRGKSVPVFLFAHSVGALVALLAAIGDHRVYGASIVSIVNSVTDSYLHWHKSDYHETVKESFKTDGKVPPLIEAFLDDPNVMEAYKKNVKPWVDLEFPYRYGLMRSASFANLAKAICYSPDIFNYADKIRFPTILFSGSIDETVSESTTELLFNKLEGKKRLVKTGAHKHFQIDQWDFIQDETAKFFSELLK